MNVVKIMGGLGNQLCQYAFSKSIEKYDDVALDISYYESHFNHSENIAHREYLLPCFVDGLKYAEEDERPRVNQWEYETGKPYKDSFFFGDWQKMSFFDGLDLGIRLKDELISEHARKIAEKMAKEESVSIHVRRTDYIDLEWDLDLSYYIRALNKIYETVPNPVLYIFSDDMDFAMRMLPGMGMTLVHEDEVNDLWLMSQCKHNIIANSTFSFWSAYLNENEGMVIYPADWIMPSPVDIQKERWISA